MTSGVPVQAIDLGVVSSQGRVRPRNEDAYGYELLYDAQGAPAGWIFVVADGVGGEYHGDIASAMAVRGVIEVYKGLNLQHPLMPHADKLGEAIQFTNADIYSKAVELNVAGHMGTTVVAAVLRPDGVLSIAWVGDSRLYVVSRRLDRIRQVSQDHTEVAEQVRQKRISQDQAANHPRRNVLSRSVGGQPETVPEFAEGLLEYSDTIVICSDGLTRHLSPDHIKTLVLQSAPSEQTAQQLVGAANQLGGKDNITALVVHIGSRESQMDTNPPVPVDSEPPPPFDTNTNSVPYESAPPLVSLNDTPQKRERRSSWVGPIMAVIVVILLVVVGLVFLSQQPSAVLPTTDLPSTDVADVSGTQDVALATSEATTAVELATAEAVSAVSLTPPTATQNITQTAELLIAGQTQMAETLNAAGTAAAGVETVAPTETPVVSAPIETATVDISQINNITQLLPNMQPAIKTLVANTLPSTPLPQENIVVPEATEAPPASPTVATATDMPAPTQTAASAAPTTMLSITATVEAVFTVLSEPYPINACLATVQEARAYSSVGGDSPYSIPANKVLVVKDVYPFKENGKNLNYYLARPNDSTQGDGWMRGDDLVPARNLTPEQQAGLILLPPTATVLTQENPNSWLPSQNLVVKDTDPAISIDCLPMRVDLASLDAIYIVEAKTPATLLDVAPKSVNGAIWWHVRLLDGREGWVQQIYLDEVTTQ